MPSFKMLANYSSPDEVLAAVKINNYSTPLANTVFVFPSDINDHNNSKNLYDRYNPKTGSNNPNPNKPGIYHTANLLSDLGMPTLGLPVENFEPLPIGRYFSSSKTAMSQLWKALGAGFNVVVVDGLSTTDPQPSNLWNPPGKENPRVSRYYAEELQIMEKYFSGLYHINTPADKFTWEIESLRASAWETKKVKKMQSPKPGAPAVEVEVEVKVATAEKIVLETRRIDPEFVIAYQEGLTEKAFQDKNMADPKAALQGTGSWFKPAPTKTVNYVYANLLKQQEKDRRWKTAVAWIFSILTVGIAAYPLYRWWKNAKDKETVQAVEMKPTQLVSLGEFRKGLLAASVANKPTEVIADRKKRPQKAYATDADAENAAANPETTVTFLMDKGEARRVNFFKAAMEQKRQAASKPLSKEEYQQLYTWTKESVADLPKFQPGH